MATLTSDVVIITIDGKWEIATAIGTAGDGTRTATKITDSIDEPRSVIAVSHGKAIQQVNGVRRPGLFGSTSKKISSCI
jgi:hypothetical protein